MTHQDARTTLNQRIKDQARALAQDARDSGPGTLPQTVKVHTELMAGIWADTAREPPGTELADKEAAITTASQSGVERAVRAAQTICAGAKRAENPEPERENWLRIYVLRESLFSLEQGICDALEHLREGQAKRNHEPNREMEQAFQPLFGLAREIAVSALHEIHSGLEREEA